jgi:hypothetical protein
MTKTISFRISNFAHSCLPARRGISLLFGLPARSRFGEGRCLGFGAYTKYYHKKKSPFNLLPFKFLSASLRIQ